MHQNHPGHTVDLSPECGAPFGFSLTTNSSSETEFYESIGSE